jgi:hypothetical protein
MSTFSCPVARVATVDNHPNADRLSILTLEGMGFTCISGKLADGSPRYAVGDLLVYIPSDSVLPSYSLSTMDIEVDTGERWMEICSISKRIDFPIKNRYQTKSRDFKETDILVLEIAIGLDRCVNAKTISERDNNGPH